MIRRTVTILLSAFAGLALGACATRAAPPPVQETAVTTAASVSLLPAIPQPPERPSAPAAVTDPAIAQAQRIDAFVAWASHDFKLDPQQLRAELAQAQFQQKSVDIISRPAEQVRPWRDYRPIFLNEARIADGRAFYAAHRDALDRIAVQTGVPYQYIVAIIGVETNYGRITGNYRALDVLYTLAFGYPKRAPFFAAELAQLFALGRDEHLDVTALNGSYAGAMGWGQFMPSSWRLWGKDGDGDGRRDLINDSDDIFASIANYFVVHGWQHGAPVVARAQRAAGAAEFDPKGLDPVYPLAELARRGYVPQPGQPRAEGATLVTFDGDAVPEYWLGYRNFYVISRYNHSPMYAMAVQQLAQAIAGQPSPDASAQ